MIKKAVITGATSGFGFAAAHLFSETGWNRSNSAKRCRSNLVMDCTTSRPLKHEHA